MMWNRNRLRILVATLVILFGCIPSVTTDSLPVATATPPSTNVPITPASTEEFEEKPTPQGDTSPIHPTLEAYPPPHQTSSTEPTIDANPPPHQTSPLLSPLGTPYSGALDPYWDIAAVDLAIADLAERLGKAPDSIKVIEIAPDEFPGDDLGCPNPKEPASNSPSMLSGYRVILQVDGENYEYHTRKNQIAFCSSPRPHSRGLDYLANYG